MVSCITLRMGHFTSSQVRRKMADKVAVLLSMQRALLGEITPDIRAIAERYNQSSVEARVIVAELPSVELKT